MQSMGYGVGFTLDSEWQAASFYTVNFTYNLGNMFREDMLVLLQNNFDYIGIDVIDNGLEWDPYIDAVYNIGVLTSGWDGLDIWFIGWLPDYNDPSNYVNSLISNISSSNSAQINDPTLEAYMLAGLQETDQYVRRQIYWDLQRYVVEELRPWAFGYVGKNYDAWISGPDYELKGYPSNGLGYNYFYPCYYESSIIPDYSIQVNHPSDVPYIEGSLGNTITWYLTAQNLSNPTYSIYRNISFIENDTWASGAPIAISVDGLSVGSYVYSIIGQNSNEIEYDSVLVTVYTEGNGDGDPEISGFPVVLLIVVSMVSLIYIRRRIKTYTRKI